MNGRQQWAETGVGAAVIAAAAAFLIYALSHAATGGGAGSYELIARFGQVGGLASGSDVRVAGVKVGSVAGIDLDPKTFLARTRVQIRSDVKIPADSSIKITSDSLLGGQHVAIEPGGSTQDLKPGAEFDNVQGAVDLFGLIGQVIRPQGGGATAPAASAGSSAGSDAATAKPAAGADPYPGGTEVRRVGRPGALAAVLLAVGAGAAGMGLAHAQDTIPPAATPPVVAPPIGPVVEDDSKPDVADAPPEEAAPPPPAAPADMAVDVAPQPVLPPEPLKRPRFTSAVLQATDKITAETLRFEARVGEPVRYKGLLLTVRACETTAADEETFDSAAHLEISSQPETPGRAPVAPRQVFRGWMFAGSPGLHPLQSPGYDVWLIACKTEAPPAPAGNA